MSFDSSGHGCTSSPPAAHQLRRAPEGVRESIASHEGSPTRADRCRKRREGQRCVRRGAGGGHETRPRPPHRAVAGQAEEWRAAGVTYESTSPSTAGYVFKRGRRWYRLVGVRGDPLWRSTWQARGLRFTAEMRTCCDESPAGRRAGQVSRLYFARDREGLQRWSMSSAIDARPARHIRMGDLNEGGRRSSVAVRVGRCGTYVESGRAGREWPRYAPDELTLDGPASSNKPMGEESERAHNEPETGGRRGKIGASVHTSPSRGRRLVQTSGHGRDTVRRDERRRRDPGSASADGPAAGGRGPRTARRSRPKRRYGPYREGTIPVLEGEDHLQRSLGQDEGDIAQE